ncbi:uncharacterized protein LOC142326829 [Lycorma delicatula]|uniref:uncharacterized protein LOC142326829 n=1 Tax=Lycorma delicatula TaxID=130591 RepID=UPI003F51A61D
MKCWKCYFNNKNFKRNILLCFSATLVFSSIQLSSIRFVVEREEIVDGIGREELFEPEDLQEIMLTSENYWAAIARYAKAVMEKLRSAEESRRLNSSPGVPGSV